MNIMNHRRRTFILATALIATGLAQNLCADDEPATEAVAPAFKDIASTLVKVEFEHKDSRRRALGVIALMDGAPYLLTNQHLLLGAENLRFTTADGKKLAPRSIELSTSRDLARLALPEDTDALELADTKTRMNTEIALFNADPDEKDRIQKGTIIGIGGLKFEISAPFGEEHNGAPVLNAAGQLVGIAGYSRKSGYHAMKKGTRFDEAERHFCYRIASNGWKRVNWKTYNRTVGTAYREHKELGDHVLDILRDRENRISSKEASEVASACRTQSRKLKILQEQRGLTDFLSGELEEHAELFEFAEHYFNDYAAGR